MLVISKFMKIVTVAVLCLTPSQGRANTKDVVASWYEYGSVTANGEKFNPDGLTVAHKSLPFNTMLLLTRNDLTITVRVNDRGPFTKGRELDLSRGAAQALGCIDSGICRIKMKVLVVNK
jgi:rare lipoprotein A